MASLVTACVFLSLSMFCCGHENLPQCAHQQSTIQSEAGKQFQIQYIYYAPVGHCTNQTCLKKPRHVNDSFLCEDEKLHTCYPRLQSSAVDAINDKCGDNQCNLWQVVKSGGSLQDPICVVYIFTNMRGAVDPCHELPSRRLKRQVTLAPSRDSTTCHSVCSIRAADKPQDGNSGVDMVWNFVHKSDRNQVEFRVIHDYSNHSKSWTPMDKYYHQHNIFDLTNRNLEIRFSLTDITSIKRLWISVEYGDEIMMHCNTTTTDTRVPDVTPTTTFNTSMSDDTSTSHVTFVVGAVVAVAAMALLSLLIIVLYRRHRRLRATPKTTSSDGPEKPSAGCTDARSQPAVPIIQTNQTHYPQVEGEQTNEIHYKQMEHEQARKSHYEQVEPEQARKSHYEEVEHEQARKSHYEQVEPAQTRKSHYEEVEPEQARQGHYEQVEPEQARQSHYEQSRQGHCKQVELEQTGKIYYEQVDHELTRQSYYEICEVPGNKKQAMTFTDGKDKDRLSNKHKAGDSTIMHPGSRNRKTIQDDAGYKLAETPDDFNCVESPSGFYGHLGRNQAMVREGENVYNHTIDQVTGQSVHNNGQASAQDAYDVYDELHRERRMVVIGNVYGTTGLKQELGAVSD